jgi:surface antigen
MRRAIIFLVLGSATIVAEARWSNWLPQLDSSDQQFIQDTARVRMNGEKIGTTLQWSNSKTGRSGTVTLLENFTDKGRQCRTNRHVINEQTTAPKTFVVSVCQNPDGTWQIVPRNKDR